MELRVLYKEETITLQVEPDGDGWRVHLPDGQERRFTAQRFPGDLLRIESWDQEIQGSSTAFLAPFARTERGLEVAWQGERSVFAPVVGGRTGQQRGRASGALAAPMVGVVADVLVAAGQTVEAYQPLVVVEAMKVMATIEAPFAGTVTAVHAEKGQRVAHGETLVELTPFPASGEAKADSG